MGVTEYKNATVKEHLLGLGCQETNVAQSISWTRGVSFTCPVSTGAHSFTIRNPQSSLITYYSSDGSSCDAILIGASFEYYQTYSSAVPTKSSLITVTGAPCNASPCCFAVFCGNPLGCDLNFDYSWTASTAAVGSFLGTIIGSVVGVLVCCICGCVSYCRYKHTCCFKSKSVSIPVNAMRRSDGTLIVDNKV